MPNYRNPASTGRAVPRPRFISRKAYPTQKPVVLLDRIIQASSNPGDVILDPFCGCGTSLESAQKNGRHWIGIDVAHYAMTLIEGRLKAKYLLGGSRRNQRNTVDRRENSDAF
ncbi:site-specific DNA-methyltransferase [Bradyrhizobium lablabi]|uniref:site-specific DNA-methyltransferase n=1 Tax=Bradyrhizobium lablabi TaxID=722472 RepID=UPI0009A67DB4|nr:site-specific DNA-methyltransferase [Bradyrhizobium lablabi]